MRQDTGVAVYETFKPGVRIGRVLEASLKALQADPRRAIQEEGIVCLLCGGIFRQLTNTHLRLHGSTPRGYKQRFGYNRRRPLMCQALRRLYIERAIRQGLAASIRCRPILSRPELRRRGGARVLALEERLTRWEAELRARVRRAWQVRCALASSPAGSESRAHQGTVPPRG